MPAITIVGTVERAARAQRTRDGEALLTLDIALPNASRTGRSVLVRVVRSYGCGEAAAYAAGASAARLRHGVRVQASGDGVHAGRGCLVLSGLIDITEPDLVLRQVAGRD